MVTKEIIKNDITKILSTKPCSSNICNSCKYFDNIKKSCSTDKIFETKSERIIYYLERLRVLNFSK